MRAPSLRRTSPKSPQAARAVASGRDDAPGRLQFNRTPVTRRKADREELIQRGLDQEVIREGCGVELGAEQPRASLQVARHHRRRDLASHVVLDDRLIEADQPDQRTSPTRTTASAHVAGAAVLGLAPVPIPRPLKHPIRVLRCDEFLRHFERAVPMRPLCPQNQSGAAKNNLQSPGGRCQDTTPVHISYLQVESDRVGGLSRRVRSLRSSSRREPYAGS